MLSSRSSFGRKFINEVWECNRNFLKSMIVILQKLFELRMLTVNMKKIDFSISYEIDKKTKKKNLSLFLVSVEIIEWDCKIQNKTELKISKKNRRNKLKSSMCNCVY